MNSLSLDLMREGMRHVASHPTRSALTALTSAIAIAVTVNVISLTFGFQDDINGTVTQFGRRTVDVSRLPVLFPGGTRPDLGPAQAVRVEGLLSDLGAQVIPRRQVAARVYAGGGEVRTMQVVGVGPDYLATMDVGLASGRWLRAGETEACVLDQAAAALLFPGAAQEDLVGQSVKAELGGAPRTLAIVGLLKDPLALRALFDAFDEGAGARTLTSSLLSFRNVYVSPATVPGEEFTGISVVLPTDEALEIARQRLLTVWPLDASNPVALARGGIGVFVRRDWMDVMGATTSTGMLLGNIVWLIVVLVAAVMISTLNLITVRERYDEVALRRCEGARRRDIALQITAEGVLLSLLGGLAGLPIGYLGARFLRTIVDFPFRFELRYALLATGIAVFLGLISSVLPARHAARLQPARVLGRRLR